MNKEQFIKSIVRMSKLNKAEEILISMDLDVFEKSIREETINRAFNELNKWVYNDENQAGDKLQIVDESDFPKIFKAIKEEER